MGFGKTLWVITRRLLMLGAFIAIFILSAAIAYYFSRGTEVAVPNVVGQTEAQARQSAAQVGLQVEIIDIYDAPEAPGKVIRQYPKAGAIVRKGGYTTLKINVSRARATSYRRDEKPKIALPDPPFDPTPWSDDLCGIPIAGPNHHMIAMAYMLDQGWTT